jgi:hypothetical protein
MTYYETLHRSLSTAVSDNLFVSLIDAVGALFHGCGYAFVLLLMLAALTKVIKDNK